jgi:hypothetical protein
MDAISLIITGAFAGLAGAGVVLFMLLRGLKGKSVFGQQILGDLSAIITQSLQATGNEEPGQLMDEVESNILNLFDDFMATKLTQKMPVLSMFIDDKLIDEIRVVFRDEMKVNLPNLLKKNMGSQQVAGLLDGVMQQVVRQIQTNMLKPAMLLLGLAIVCGAIIGLLASVVLG